MDMFYDNMNILEKKRVHFNEFMLSIHQQLHRIKSVNIIRFFWLINFYFQNKIKDPLSHIAALNAKSYRLLCLDEFQVQNNINFS